MDREYFWVTLKITPWKFKYLHLLCLFGHHDGVYGIQGVNKYHVNCYRCNKRLDEGIDL